MILLCVTVSNETKGYCINVPKLLKYLDKIEFSIDLLDNVDIDKFTLSLSNNIDGRVLSWVNLTTYSTKDLKVLKINDIVVHPKYYKYVGKEIEVIKNSLGIPIGWAVKEEENYDREIKETSIRSISKFRRINNR